MSGISCQHNAIRHCTVSLAAVTLLALAICPAAADAQTAVGMMAGGGSGDSGGVGGASSVVGNPGEVRLVFDRVEAVFNNRIVVPATANLGFVWATTGDAACTDGLNNDDHTVLGHGQQDSVSDFPDDPECVSLEDASEDKAGLQERRPVVFSGTLDGEGRLLIPSSGIDIPTIWAWSSSGAFGGDCVRTYDFEPVGGAVGIINPFTRDLGLHLRFRIRVSVEGAGSFTGPGDQCYVGTLADPIAIQLSTIEVRSEAGLPPLRGVAYEPGSGALELAGYNIAAVAGVSDCGVFGSINDVIGAAFGVPAAPGNIRLRAVGRIEPVPVIADGATPTMLRLPRELFPAAQLDERPSRRSDAVLAPSPAEVKRVGSQSRPEVAAEMREVPKAAEPAKILEVPKAAEPAKMREVPKAAEPAKILEVPAVAVPAQAVEVPAVAVPAQAVEVPAVAVPAQAVEVPAAELVGPQRPHGDVPSQSAESGKEGEAAKGDEAQQAQQAEHVPPLLAPLPELLPLPLPLNGAAAPSEP